MPWPYTKTEITDVLVDKFGFEQDDRDHDFYVLTLDDRDVAYTYVSRGHRDRVDPKTAFKMMKEMRLETLEQFRDAMDCPLSCDEYYALLRVQRQAREGANAEPPASPRQPLRWVWTLTGLSFGYVQDAALYTYEGRNVGRLAGGSEEIYGLDGKYLGEIHNYNVLVVDEDKREYCEDATEEEPLLKAVHPWADRDAYPIEGVVDFPHPDSFQTR